MSQLKPVDRHNSHHPPVDKTNQTFTAAETTRLNGQSVQIYSLPHFAERVGVQLNTIPFVGRVLLEALLRSGDRESATLLAHRLAAGTNPDIEMLFRPARILMQDFTGIPLLVDLAAIRDAVRDRGGAAERVNPAIPTQVVVDHSLQVDHAGTAHALALNEALELDRNQERYAFLKWAEQAFENLEVIAPGQGIVHQINLEQLATVVTLRNSAETVVAFPDTVIGTDSHTTMVNGLGVLGWGVGGLEAEAAMLGLAQPIAIPPIVGVRLAGQMRPGVAATDVALALTQYLRSSGVNGALLEFTGAGVAQLAAADRCTIANMAPEYGAMAAFFPVDAETLRYLQQTGRSADRINLVEAYCRQQQLWRDAEQPEPRFAHVLEFDLSSVAVGLAGPSHPHQHLSIAELPASFQQFRSQLNSQPHSEFNSQSTGNQPALQDGDIVIAAITSCTNTSNPTAMLAAGLLAQRAVERGLTVPAHVKTSLAPGSRAVTEYLQAAGLLPALEALGFAVVGYGCATCNGGSGPLAAEIAAAITAQNLTVCAVLSGNRNFSGRVHAQVQAAYLASPALVIALALVGHVRGNLETEPIGFDRSGAPVFLADLWPEQSEIADLEARYVIPPSFAHAAGSLSWQHIAAEAGPFYAWTERSTYIRRPSYLKATALLNQNNGITGARALALLGNDVSTDHISPVGAIPPDSPAGKYLQARGVAPAGLNSYGSRRGNHEVMARGTFANSRLRNQMLPGVEGGYTLHVPTQEHLPIYEAASRYADTATPLLILAGQRYGMGSSRDWAAKGPWLLGVRAVIAESFERIHRSNLCAMGILPLLFPSGESWASLGLDGQEEFTLEGLNTLRQSNQLLVQARGQNGRTIRFTTQVDIHSAGEWEVWLQGGMLPYLLRNLEYSAAFAHEG